MTLPSRVQLFRGITPERAECERELVSAWKGVLPLPARLAWSDASSHSAGALLAARDERGSWRSGVGLAFIPSRAVPGGRILHVHRAGAGVADADIGAMVRAVRLLADASPLVLRVQFEVFSRDEAERLRFADPLRSEHFLQVARPAAYEYTISVDMAGRDDQALLRSFSEQARRHIRHLSRHPVRVTPITDPALAPALDRLMRAAFQRTGGVPPRLNWRGIITAAQKYPDLMRIAAIFRATDVGCGDPLGFALGCMHGDYMHYDAAGSMRVPDLKAPLGYGPVWDLMQWGRALGADWFDFGGVSVPVDGVPDPLAGISDFKRGFSTTVQRVHDEWVYEPHPVIARTADATRAVARTVRGLLRRFMRT